MPLFRKKPVVIEAVQLVPDNEHALIDFLAAELRTGEVLLSRDAEAGTLSAIVQTKEGAMSGSPGDWIIRGVKGELYPCKPDIFEATYEVESAVAAPPTTIEMLVNGREVVCAAGSTLTYEAIVSLAGMSGHPTVTYSAKPIGDTRRSGTMYAGKAPLELVDGMVINAMHTGNA